MIGEFPDTWDVINWLAKQRLIKNCMLCLWQCDVSTKKGKMQLPSTQTKMDTKTVIFITRLNIKNRFNREVKKPKFVLNLHNKNTLT